MTAMACGMGNPSSPYQLWMYQICQLAVPGQCHSRCACMALTASAESYQHCYQYCLYHMCISHALLFVPHLICSCLRRGRGRNTSSHKLGVLANTYPAHVSCVLGTKWGLLITTKTCQLFTTHCTVQGWERGSHGTGMGHTTNKGFWIPEKPSTPPPGEMLALPEAPRAGGRGATGRPSRKHPKLPAGPKLPRGGGRQPKEIKQETDQESQHEDEPPEVRNTCTVI